jgi:transketolase
MKTTAIVETMGNWRRPSMPVQRHRLSIDCIRTLSMDAVQQANSGHPGPPMALAPLVYTLWNRVMRFDPQDPIWSNRDRFVLSNGHALMLLWSVLHLSGTRTVNADYEWLARPAVSLEDLRGPFHRTKGRPTFIILDSHTGYGSPHKQDTAGAHGEPLGEEEIRLVEGEYGRPEAAKFLVPEVAREHFAAGIGARGAQAHRRWSELFAAHPLKYPELATEIDLMQRRELPAGWSSGLPVFPADHKGIAGRDASGKVLNALARNIPWLLGGSADFAPSSKTTLTIEGVEDGVARGAYATGDAPGGNLEVVLIGSGSELSLCANAHELAEGTRSRVVSMPSWNSVLPPDVTARVAVEQASTRQVGPQHQHEDIRRLGPTQSTAAEIRIRAGVGDASRQSTGWLGASGHDEACRHAAMACDEIGPMHYPSQVARPFKHCIASAWRDRERWAG